MRDQFDEQAREIIGPGDKTVIAICGTDFDWERQKIPMLRALAAEILRRTDANARALLTRPANTPAAPVATDDGSAERPMLTRWRDDDLGLHREVPGGAVGPVWVKPLGEGWEWCVVYRGCAVARGTAPSKEAAMDAADEAARRYYRLPEDAASPAPAPATASAEVAGVLEALDDATVLAANLPATERKIAKARALVARLVEERDGAVARAGEWAKGHDAERRRVETAVRALADEQAAKAKAEITAEAHAAELDCRTRGGEKCGTCRECVRATLATRDAELAQTRATLADYDQRFAEVHDKHRAELQQARDSMCDAVPLAAIRPLLRRAALEAFRRARLDGTPEIEKHVAGAVEEAAGAVRAGAIGDWHAELTKARADLATLRGAMTADDERLRTAAKRVGIVAGCDAAGEMADEIERLRGAAEAARREATLSQEALRLATDAFRIQSNRKQPLTDEEASELAELRRYDQSCQGGDRPISPPVAKLRRLMELEARERAAPQTPPAPTGGETTETQ